MLSHPTCAFYKSDTNSELGWGGICYLLLELSELLKKKTSSLVQFLSVANLFSYFPLP